MYTETRTLRFDSDLNIEAYHFQNLILSGEKEPEEGAAL
jgi:hypothetical protein